MSIFPTKILLATDGSGEAESAAQVAAELADKTGSELHVVYVEMLPYFAQYSAGTVVSDRELYEKVEEEARETLRKLTWQVKVAGICSQPACRTAPLALPAPPSTAALAA